MSKEALSPAPEPEREPEDQEPLIPAPEEKQEPTFAPEEIPDAQPTHTGGITRRQFLTGLGITLFSAAAGGIAADIIAHNDPGLFGIKKKDQVPSPTATSTETPPETPTKNPDQLLPASVEAQTQTNVDAFFTGDRGFLRTVEPTMYNYIQPGGAVVKAPTGVPNHLSGYDGQLLSIDEVTPDTFAKQVMIYRVPLVLLGPTQRGTGALILFGGFENPGQQFSEGTNPYVLGLYCEHNGGILKPDNRIIDNSNRTGDLGRGNPQDFPDLKSLLLAIADDSGKGVQINFGTDPNLDYGDPAKEQAYNQFCGELGTFFMATWDGETNVKTPQPIFRRPDEIPGTDADMSPYYRGYSDILILE